MVCYFLCFITNIKKAKIFVRAEKNPFVVKNLSHELTNSVTQASHATQPAHEPDAAHAT